jgi:flagellar hook-length control protein FliK
MTSRLLSVAALALALAAPAHAQQASADPDDADAAMPPLPMTPMPPMGPPPGVRKITDGALSCDQIYAESRGLEESIARHRATSDAAQAEATAAQDAMMKQANSAGSMPMGAGLLGMIPGAGMFSGMAAQAAVASQRSAMQESTAKVTSAYQRMAQAQEQLAYAQGRNDHLVGLFLQKNCKLPDGAKP